MAGFGNRPQFNPNNRPKKPQGWSHQRHLDSLKGKKISINLVGDAASAFGFNCTLIEADAYSLLVLRDQSKMTYFKHDIRSFKEV